MAPKRGGLGKGLDLIFMENETEDAGGAVQGREGLVQLRHFAADGGLRFHDVHREARLGDVQSRLDPRGCYP